MSNILKTPALPYCKGCGHDLIAKNTAKALEDMGLRPLDVIVVTDIGCHGIIDGCLNTHTVHGLHGRSVALGAGIAFGLKNPGKKIIVFIGDGGSTIGLQHILEAARLNLDMTVVVHNNMLYGMTGGQTSGLTPCGFRTSTSVSGNPWSGYDLCALAHTSGAAYTGRIAGIGDISSSLGEAFAVKGFSLTEVIEICPSYGVKFNPGRKLSEIIESSGKLPGKWENRRDPFGGIQRSKSESLFDDLDIIGSDFKSSLEKPFSLIISGSAGEGVQLAAGLLSAAVVRSGLHVTQKGSYPVTVGVGFSTAELIISPFPIGYHGIDIPDIVVVTSGDGLANCRSRIENMADGILFIDSSLQAPETGATVHSYDFRSIGARAACLFAIFRFADSTGYISKETLYRTISDGGLSDKIPVKRISELIDG
jgi:2-oxoglutarate/2-oxoacid ferredoxin oxidoreductase subunit beta